MAVGKVNLFFRMIAEKSGWNALSAQVKNAMGDVNGLSAAAKKMGMAFGRAGGVIGSVVSNAFKGGIWGVMEGVVHYSIDKIREWREAAKKAAQELAEHLREKLQHAAEETAKRFERISNALERASKSARELATRSSAVGDAETAEATAAIRAKAHGKGAVANAAAGVEVARVESANALKKADRELALAREEEARAAERTTAAEEAVREAKANVVKAENEYHTAVSKDVDDETLAAEEKNMAAMHAALEKAEANLVKARADETSAANAAVVAYQKRRIARVAANEKVIAAEDALAAAQKKEAEEREEAAKEAKKKRQEEAQAALDKAEFEESLKDEQRKIDEAALWHDQVEGLQERRFKIAKEVGRINEALARIDKRDAARKKTEDRLAMGREADARHTTGSFGPYQYGGRSNGEANGTDDMRADRFAGRGERDAQKGSRRDAMNRARADRIRGMSEQARSQADKDWLKKWDEINGRRTQEAQDAKARELLQKKRDRLLEENNSILKDIKECLETANKVG